VTNSLVNTSPAGQEQVIIRVLKKNDLPELEWGGEYTHFRRLFADAYESAQRGRSVLWVAELPGMGILGQLFVQLTSGRSELADGYQRGYIYGFRLKPLYRSRGIGTQMMEVAEQDLLRRGFQWVTLNVGRDNPQARRLYERRGYRVVANEPGEWSYYDDKGVRRQVHEPAWRMEKKLY
jgi:ribosomal protein S18 acetylase RimI-like enzyme